MVSTIWLKTKTYDHNTERCVGVVGKFWVALVGIEILREMRNGFYLEECCFIL